MYDYLIVGAGLSGAIFAHEATKRGKKVNTVLTFSIRPTKKSGTMLTSSLNSITILILQ